MAFDVDPGSAVPPYEQLRAQVAEQIASGRLLPGDQLPTVRRLAADLGLAPNTVARAYRELEAAGAVRTAGRRGTVIAQPSDDVGADTHRVVAEFTARMRGLGLSVEETVQLVRQAFPHQA